MEKRSDIQIYVLSHKDIPYQREDALYSPLQQGNYPENLWTLRDNTGDNISDLNPLYAETTGIYWVWKNRPKDLKYVGICQYRRRLEFPEDENFDNLFSSCDVVTMTPLSLGLGTPQWQYASCHNPDDIILTEAVVKEFYPELAEGWDRVMKGQNRILYSNGMIMPAGAFDQFCSFLFTVLGEVFKRKGWKTLDDVRLSVEEDILRGRRKGFRGVAYQQQLGGFLCERLWTFWCFSHFTEERTRFMDYLKFEGV